MDLEQKCEAKDEGNVILMSEEIKHRLGDKNRITKPFLTKYEKAKVIGYRAEQLASGTPSTIKVRTETDVVVIATRELEERKLPFIIKRPLSNGGAEYWYLNELELI